MLEGQDLEVKGLSFFWRVRVRVYVCVWRGGCPCLALVMTGFNTHIQTVELKYNQPNLKNQMRTCNANESVSVSPTLLMYCLEKIVEKHACT